MWQAVQFASLSAVWWFADVCELRKIDALAITGIVFFAPWFPAITLSVAAIIAATSGLLDGAPTVRLLVYLLGSVVYIFSAGVADVASVMIATTVLWTAGSTYHKDRRLHDPTT